MRDWSDGGATTEDTEDTEMRRRRRSAGKNILGQEDCRNVLASKSSCLNLTAEATESGEDGGARSLTYFAAADLP
jgi:hypothetical protein